MTVAYDESARRTANELANINYSASDRVANSSDAWQQGQGQNLTTWLGKGVTLLLNGDWDKANYHVRVVTEKEPGSIPGQLAKAALHFHREQYAEALATYQKVLKMAPQLQKPDVRVGIGLCFERLRMVDHAKHAFERALDRVGTLWRG